MPRDHLTTPELRQAFHDALGAYQNWEGDGGPEPSVSIQGGLGQYHVSISGVCDLVLGFSDRMPRDWHDMLVRLAERVGTGRFIPRDQSYHGGARCLKGLIDFEERRQRARAIP